MQRRTFVQSVLAGPAALAGEQAFAQGAWPAKPVRLVIAHPPGSGVDAIARIVAERYSHAFGVSFVVDNKPGGQNVIGASNVSHSPPDGYTVYLATTVALVTNIFLIKDLPYDPRKDFAPIGFVGLSPFVMVVSDQSKYKSLTEFVAAAKAAPGRITVATEGPKTFGGITARLFNSKLGVQTNLISYSSSGVALQDLMGGQVDAFFIDIAAAAPLTKQGKLRMLAVTSAKRVDGWDVPALAETAPGFDMVGWFCLVAPVGTPAPIITKLNTELVAAMNDKAVAGKIRDLGPDVPGAGTPDELKAFLAKETAKWSSVSSEIGLLPE